MNLKTLSPLLLSLFIAPAFAHSTHDDELPVPVKQEAVKTPAAKSAKKDEHGHSNDEGKAEKKAAATPAKK